MIRKKIFSLSIGIILFILTGCAAITAKGPIFDHVVESDPAMATIYFYRGTDISGVPSLETIPVTNGGKIIGELYRGGYFTYKIKPGKYQFYTDIKGTILDNIQEVELEENNIYFMKSVFRSIFLSNTNSLEIIPEQQAIDELRNFRFQTL